jgi:hypothetical protein
VHAPSFRLQAVQFVEELRVEPGQSVKLTAKHDTYSISYSLADNDEGLLRQLSTGVPMKVRLMGRGLAFQGRRQSVGRSRGVV